MNISLSTLRHICFAAFILLLGIQTVNAQNTKKITGKVVDESGEVIIGASIVATGRSIGTVTDIDGKFSLEVAPKTTLTISYIGFSTQTIAVDAKDFYEIVLQEDAQHLDEVVIVGYGTQKKGSITGSVVAVNNKELSITKNQNAQNMLTGKVPGVRVIQKTSEPGEFNNQFDIRGFGSPLIVIDGVPRGQDAFARLSPDEIENISVLKDASAAVYGVRAANGVVLITTKKGEKGKSKINYSMFYGIQTPADLLKPINAVDRMILFNTTTMRDQINPRLSYSDEQIEEYRNGTKQSTDWYGAVLTDYTPQQQHDINFSGGSEKVDYFVNFGYQTQDGFFRSGDLNYERYNLRSNINAQITKRLKMSMKINGIMDNKNRPLYQSWEVYGTLWRMLPDDPIYANNNPEYLKKTAGVPNVLGYTNADLSGFVKNNRKMFQSNASFEYDMPYITGLKLKGMYSYDMTLTDNTTFKKSYNEYEYNAANDFYTAYKMNSPSGGSATAAASLDRSYGLGQTHLWQLSLNYDRTFAEKHNVSALLLYEESHSTGDNLHAYRQLEMPLPYLYTGNKDLTQVGDANAGGISDYVYKGIVGRINYDFAGKYLAEFSFRRDGSSQFAPNEGRWGFFPGGSLGWRLSEENFIKDNLSFLQNLKLRGSYGILGDDGAMDYQWVTGYDYPLIDNIGADQKGANIGPPAGYVYDGAFLNGLGFRVIPNMDITWFTSTTANIGLDADLWSGLFGFSLDVFQRDREGLLVTRISLVPGTFGSLMPQENLNSDRTKGFEIELKHRNKIDQVSYGISGNLAMTRTQNLYRERTPSGNSYDNWRNNNSYRYNDIWFGYGSAGRYKSYEQIANSPINVGLGTLPGDYIYEDWNEDGVIDGADYHPIGTISNAGAGSLNDKHNYPLMNFALTLTAAYRGFDFSALFQGAAMSNVAYGEQLSAPLAWDGNAVEMLLDRWYPVDPKKDPYDPSNQWVSGNYAYGKGGVDTNSKFGIQNGAYLRLKTIELGYSLPKDWLKKVGINNLRLYINAYNLFTITGVKGLDPERPSELYGQMYPLNKTFNFGLNMEL
ncbi:MAG: TonB-dependent receptor SusC [Candidatus Ordinivivax streblomastigis]|uniref:TonB-dependent receptor SusC n=1 Tax=Candidatus Ordinivivax streblomastigis TaxID=2540710 RepID=A0A5M8P5A1_9BACT|nr:MAG: TonB-dependent receptor SusC [Candidatus Ordinivivax streblomastigis]